MARSFSQHQANAVVQRLRSAEAFDEGITLSAEEVAILIQGLNRLAYKASRTSR